MPSDDTTRDLPNDPGESRESANQPVIDSSVGEPGNSPPPPPRGGWRRRTFLQAAALGTAAAALINRDGVSLGWGTPSVGAAAVGTCTNSSNGVTYPDLSFLSCTANDVTLDQVAQVVNEPCTCTGTFSAVVMFSVTNHTGTGRYCIQLSIGSGLAVPCQDIILRNSLDSSGNPTGSSTLPANSTITMYGSVVGFPCNTGGQPITIGPANTPASGACPSECVTVGWSTSSGSADCSTFTKVPGGQCRHQQVTIQGFGVGLACASGCQPACGGTSTLTATVSTSAVSGGQNPFVYVLNGSDGSQQIFPATATLTAGCPTNSSTSTGGTASTSHTFTVTPPNGTTTYTVKVFDLRLGGCCFRTSSSVSLTTTQIPAPVITKTSGPDCAGNVSFSATDSASGVTFGWTATNANPASGSGATFSTTVTPGKTSTIAVTATSTTSPSCTNSASTTVSVNASVTASIQVGPISCSSGSVTLKAIATNGSGTFSWSDWTDTTTNTDLSKVAGATTTISADTLTNTLTLPAGTLAANSNDSISVTVTDTTGSAGECTFLAQTTVQIPAAVQTSLNTGSTPDCKGNLTFTASATGGTGPYKFTWTIDGKAAGSTTSQLVYPPNVDCNPHTIAVTATDSNSCTGNTVSRTVTQVVNTTVA